MSFSLNYYHHLATTPIRDKTFPSLVNNTLLFKVLLYPCSAFYMPQSKTNATHDTSSNHQTNSFDLSTTKPQTETSNIDALAEQLHDVKVGRLIDSAMDALAELVNKKWAPDSKYQPKDTEGNKESDIKKN